MKSILAIFLLGTSAALVGQAHAQIVSADSNLDAGAAVFAKCKSCHQLGPDAQNSVGPVLNGVVSRKAGTYPGYGYSPATRNSGLVWDPQTLAKYLRSPRDLVPGTRMAFAGLKKDRELDDVIAYLAQFDADGSRRKSSTLDRGGQQNAGKAEGGKIGR